MREYAAARLAHATAVAWLADALSNLPHPELSDLRDVAAGLTDQPVDVEVPVEAQRRVPCLTAALRRRLLDMPAPDPEETRP